MPFNNSYIDAEKMSYANSRNYFISLASRIVKESLTTHIVKTSRHGKTLFLVIDRNIKSEEGALVVIEIMKGYKIYEGYHRACVGNNYLDVTTGMNSCLHWLIAIIFLFLVSGCIVLT